MSDTGPIVGLGARTDYVAAVPNADIARLRLTPEEVALFLKVSRATQIGALIAGSGLPEAKTISLLLSLRVKGAIVPARVKAAAPAVELSAALDEEVELDQARKKEVLDLERMLDGANHFEVFGLRPGTSPEEVKKAFYEASRRYHPDRYFGKNLGSFRARMERIFKRLSEAHQILTDPKKRAEYLGAHPDLAVAPAPKAAPEAAVRPRTAEDEKREAERRARFAKHPYLAKTSRVADLLGRAKGLIAAGDPGKAYTDLHLASQIDDKNLEIKQLLESVKKQADLQRAKHELERGEKALREGERAQALMAFRNGSNIDPTNATIAARVVKHLLEDGADPKEIRLFAQRATEADPKNADHHAALGMVLLGLGMKESAKRQFEEALQLDPGHAEAKKHVKKWWALGK